METGRKRIIAAGHVCLDITPVFNPGVVFSDVSEAFIPGNLVNVDTADIHTGGSVSNTGLALKKLGADVVLLGKVGDDVFGKLVVDIFAEHGAGGIRVAPGCATSYSVVLAPPGLDRIFLHNPGANNAFCASDVPDSVLDSSELLHFGYPPVMKHMYENGGEELVRLFRRAKGKNLLTSLDMSLINESSDAAGEDWRRILANVLPYVDYFVPSYEETAFFLGYEDYDLNRFDFDKDVKPLAHELRGMGARTVLIKCGTAGMYFLSDEEEGIQPAFKADRICSATGAGDTAIAAFLISVLNGKSLADSARLAAAEGACCVTAYDSLSGLQPLDVLERRIASGWETI